ncbi:MAG: CRISPR-associated endoribonuclease Cas6 [Patescibacteria group bacterium]|nr:CRISPR-associated endoribonuclease Cas6 [Patescibacteria group bacterium]
MRFSCNIYFNKNKIEIPSYYRANLLSLIKESFKLSSDDDFIALIYDQPVKKLFTFSVYMPLDKIKNKLVLKDNFIKFFFSSNDHNFLIRCYNGLLQISNNKKNNFSLFGENNFTIKNFFLFPLKKINNETITFKTLSPFLIRDREDGDYYLIPDDIMHTKELKYQKIVGKNYFIENIKYNIEGIWNIKKEKRDSIFNEIDVISYNLLVTPIRHSSNNPKHPQFNITLPGLKGTITIKARKDILQLLYDIGLGARRSEGFGMLEVVG